MKKKKKRKLKVRFPVPNKASRPMSTKKGKKGYKRRKKHQKDALNSSLVNVEDIIEKDYDGVSDEKTATSG